MLFQEFRLQAKDQIELYTQDWKPEIKPVGVVCLVHGLGEHCGRYAHMAEFLNQAGYGFLIMDLRGHGKSGGPRGHIPSIEAVIADIEALIGEAPKLYPGLPCFLYGHSLGGILVLNYVLRRHPNLTGVISSGAALRNPLEKQIAKVMTARLLARLFPTMALPSGLDPQMISRDPEVVRKYINDPLVHDRMTLRFGVEMMNATRYALEHASEFSLPLLMMHGTEDQIAYQEGSLEFASQVHTACMPKIWEGCFHEIHNEPEKGEVFQYLLDWLNRTAARVNASKFNWTGSVAGLILAGYYWQEEKVWKNEFQGPSNSILAT